jgi:hypothetical protein
MGEKIELKKCKQEHCTISKDGICLENLEPEDCPHFYLESGEEDEGNGDDQSEKPESGKNIQLYSGFELSTSEIKLVTERFPSNIVIIIGESECGKTTLLATVFELFQMGTFAEHCFAGSLTLRGFEIRCHLARLASKGKKPDTEKTISNDFKFLHLSLKSCNPLEQDSINLVLSDISGERFKAARDDPESMNKLSLLTIADHLIFIIDGKKIQDPREFAGTLFSAESFIRRAIDTGVFNKSTYLNVVVSKWDTLHNSEFDKDKKVEAPIRNKFEKHLSGIQFSYIASRPEFNEEELKFGFGLDQLLKKWVIPKSRSTDTSVFEQMFRNDEKRFFRKYSIRENAE